MTPATQTNRRSTPSSPRHNVTRPYRLQRVKLSLVRSRRAAFQATQPTDVAKAFAHLGREVRESFWTAYLDGANSVICVEQLSVGTIGESHASPAEVVRTALLVGARAVILVHNHPSGHPQPSPQDREVTRRIAEAARIFELTVHDHVIIGTQGRYYSFAEEAILPGKR
jgi:DNA repair protein RadC